MINIFLSQIGIDLVKDSSYSPFNCLTRSFVQMRKTVDVEEKAINLRESTLKAFEIHTPIEAIKVASLWKDIALDKAERDINASEQFIACVNVCTAIELYLDDSKRCYFCEDGMGNIQGMMVLQMDPFQVQVSELVTNPINIRASVNENEVNKVRGVGTYLLQIAEEIAKNNGKCSVYLHHGSSSIAFYKKNGYQETDLMTMTKQV